MFCKKCGNQISESAAFCSQCGEKTGEALVPPQSTQEILVMQGLCNRVKSSLYVQNGKGMLTNQRFIYLKHSFAKIMAIGVFINLTSGDYDFDIPLANISSIEDGRQGISKTIIINTKDGERYNFYFTNREEWKIAFQNAIRACQK